MANFCLNASIDLSKFLVVAGDRIQVSGDKWLLSKFILFQYGDLTDRNKIYQSVCTALGSFSQNKGHLSPLNGGKDKDKEKDKEIGGCGGCGHFQEFWSTYPPRDGKKLEKAATEKAFSKVPESEHNLVIAASRNYANSGQLAKDPKRFLKDGYWREWIEPARVTEPGKKTAAAPIRNMKCRGCDNEFPPVLWQTHHGPCETAFLARTA